MQTTLWQYPALAPCSSTSKRARPTTAALTAAPWSSTSTPAPKRTQHSDSSTLQRPAAAPARPAPKRTDRSDEASSKVDTTLQKQHPEPKAPPRRNQGTTEGHHRDTTGGNRGSSQRLPTKPRHHRDTAKTLAPSRHGGTPAHCSRDPDSARPPVVNSPKLSRCSKRIVSPKGVYYHKATTADCCSSFLTKLLPLQHHQYILACWLPFRR